MRKGEGGRVKLDLMVHTRSNNLSVVLRSPLGQQNGKHVLKLRS